MYQVHSYILHASCFARRISLRNRFEKNVCVIFVRTRAKAYHYYANMLMLRVHQQSMYEYRSY